MRCSCTNCGEYMIQAEDMKLGCICPECFSRCTACLGTNSMLSKDDLKNMSQATPWFSFNEAVASKDDDAIIIEKDEYID